ncbi:MAG: glycoside hydrolase family 2 protein [Oscillospiraceae bacterium]|nr:glycoside hydrolase family 2 protein [Oscillospiraceae bacterium]
MISLCNGWEFDYNWSEEFAHFETEAESVRLPHNVKELPLHCSSPSDYETVCGYRRIIDAPADWAGKRVFLQLDGAAHIATVFLNGKVLGSHRCGYTAFRTELTEELKIGSRNELAVKLDCTENKDIPPFGFVIDYLTYGGLYREAWLDVRPENHLEDLFVYASDDGIVRCRVKTSETRGSLEVRIVSPEGETVGLYTGNERCFDIPVENAKLWDIDNPNVYSCKVVLKDGETDEKTERFGFRRAEFKADGFYLNGKKLFLRGLNRHQCYPYIGYAAPERLQRQDAYILKHELGCTAVRTSHYPQSRYFIDECDREGLLVFTEIPGWQHIGDLSWQEQAVENVREMIEQYRNHPSIVLWGVRINESQDNDAFYRRTNRLAHELDPSRQTGGVRYITKSSLLEDVYTFNDFSHNGGNGGVLKKYDVTPDMSKGFLISEHSGHMFPTKAFDPWLKRQQQAIRHASVLNDAMADNEHAGCFGWCMFDYATHRDFGSGDRICYHGVTDAFRNPKTAAALYASQGDESAVLEIGSPMAIGDYSATEVGTVYLFTNADEVLVYRDGVLDREVSETPFKALPHGPMPFEAGANDWGGQSAVWRFDAVKDGEVVSSVTRSPSAELHIETDLSCLALTEGDKYDASAVRIRIKDKNGCTASYAQIPLKIEAEGSVRLLGPDIVTAEGGMTGVYVGTTGEKGAGYIKISSPGFESVTVSFKVN